MELTKLVEKMQGKVGGLLKMYGTPLKEQLYEPTKDLLDNLYEKIDVEEAQKGYAFAKCCMCCR